METELITKDINACLHCGKKNLFIRYSKKTVVGGCKSRGCCNRYNDRIILYNHKSIDDQRKGVKSVWNAGNMKPERAIKRMKKSIKRRQKEIDRIKKLFGID
jgi:hypothetical protein